MEVYAWWHGGRGDNHHTNWGDIITPVIIKAFSGVEPIRRKGPGKHIVVGSVLDKLQPRDIVWGAGVISPRKLPTPVPDSVQVKAVRGPLTRRVFQKAGFSEVPEVYGDPAILMPFILRAPEIEVRHRLGFIPHINDVEHVRQLAVSDPAIKFIDICGGLHEVVEDILSCEMIISTSLHGIIAAEAYGRPAVWAQVDGATSLMGGDFKFKDYYYSTNRDPVPVNLPRSSTALPAIKDPELPNFDVNSLFATCPFNLKGLKNVDDLGSVTYEPQDRKGRI